MMKRASLSLLLATAGILGISYVAADTCVAAPQTLSSSCGDVCDSTQPCLTYNASVTSDECSICVDDGDDVCSYACFNIDRQSVGDYSVTFLIPFGAYQSEQELYERSQNADFDSLVKQMDDKTDTYPFANNNLLTSIDPITLPANTTTFILAGGTDWDYVVKSKVVDVDLASDMLTSVTELNKVEFISLNLETRIADLPTLLPPYVVSLSLGNTLLSSFPVELGSLAYLQELLLNYNYVSEVASTDTIETVTYLGLAYNELTSFEALFPNLISLDLAGNYLTEIPSVIFEHKSLQDLYLDQNSFTTAEFTSSQVAFLKNLTTLDLKASSFSADLPCDASQQTTVHSLTVCVTDAATESSDDSAGSNASTSSGGSSNTGVIIGIVVGVVVLVLGIVIACLCYRRKRHQDKLTATNTGGVTPVYTGFTGATNGSITDPSDATGSLWSDTELLQLQVRVEDIQDLKKIGNGAYGVVWLVKYRNTQLLASKRIQRDHATRQRTQDFIDEIKLVSKLDHPNIVHFIGVAWSVHADLQALFEYMENGDLREYLIQRKTNREWNAEKLQIAVDIVEALVYVHSFQPPLVHRDLKSRNVLLTNEMGAKLTDFGVSRFRSQDNTMTSGVGTSRWLAPEVISGSSDYDQAADIYSFGVVLSELDTHEVPYGDACGATGNPLADVAILQMVAAGTLRPSFRASSPHAVLEIADRCLAQHPSQRPTAPEVAYALRSIQKKMFGGFV